MNSLLRLSLLASIQTVRTILLGMEAMLKEENEEKKVVYTPAHREEAEEMDLETLAKTIGLVGNGGRDVQN